MMQQFATSSSKIAVNTLEMGINSADPANNDTYRSFEQSRSAFEKAIADAEQSAFVTAGDISKGSGVFKEQSYVQPVIREAAATDKRSQTSEALESAQKAEALEGESEQLKPSSIDTQSKPADAASTLRAEDKPENALAVADELGIDSDGSKYTANEFDYINFVTDIKSLTEDTLNNDITPESSLLTAGIAANEQSLDLSNISLTEDELQIILDAQQAGLDLQDSLSEEQLLKLSNAISSMLSQFHEQSESSNTQSAAASELDALDIKLLETMIVQAPVSKQEVFTSDDKSIEVALEVEPPKINEATDTAALQNEVAVVNTLAGDGILVAETGLSTEPNIDETLSNKQSEIKQNTAIPVDQATLQSFETKDLESSIANDTKSDAEIRSADRVTADVVTTNIVAKSEVIKTDTQNKTTSENSDAVLKQIVALDERSQTNIIENIKSRVEKFVADLSGNSSKGSEFVAAMQTGLKELKEQMQSGREPGIDLKALISDAMLQLKVEIPAQTQAKVDTVLNQFAGLMNLANAVNQSSQAQAQQLFGLTETQIVKESNVLHTEGTKLAQHTPTNFDKAVNIFKPEGQQHLAEKVRWMINGRNPAAEIRFDPPELGAMQIKINMSADTAAVSFTVQSATAKEALDQALPKLREMLQEQGIELGQSSVQQEAKGQSQQNNEQTSGGQGASNSELAGGQAEVEADLPPVFEQRISGGSLGGIDYYA
ncbi:flagellar hook-length control protein FliK [Glaciecola sp. SC05]|uniref:flagellar hook-length control protein FliK n=1 Tax=Glaciecola sp. SC05 TaxID=1987355 RepID=UPI003529C6C1